ncbi:MAG: hypothetical protein JXC85_03860 [Candidatus Aenigmarchaeota archaeon]|nr:hypothetical protein [Candidatus Aenigmarchaeota archaeon]
MDEISRVEVELKRLRDDAENQKSAAQALKKENTLLKSRNDYLLNKLKEASYVYGEAGKRLLYFINNQVNPVVERLNKLEGGSRKLGTEDRMLGESILSLKKSMNESLGKLDARIAALAQELDARDDRLGLAIKGSVTKTQKVDAALGESITGALAETDKKLDALRLSLDRKVAGKAAALEKDLNAKINMLRERNLIIGKDIEAIMKFEQDIGGLDGRLQETIANLSQTKLDMEKLEGRIKGVMSKKEADISGALKGLADDVDRKVLSFSSDLRQKDEKNLRETMLRLEEIQAHLARQLESANSARLSFERKVDSKVRKAGSALRSGLGSEIRGVDERLRMLEKGIDGNARAQKDSEKAILGKISSLDSGLAAASGEIAGLREMKGRMGDMVKQAATMSRRIQTTEAGVNENIASFKDRFERNRIIIKNELQKIDKKIDERVKLISSELGKENAAVIAKLREDNMAALISLRSRAEATSKEVARLKALTSDIKALAAGLRKADDADAALQSKIDAISRQVMDKSERDDMRLKKQLDLLKSEIKSGLEAAESRITEENVKAFSAARHNLRQDVHALREDNAALKADVKGLHSLAAMVTGMQKSVAGMEKRMDAFGNSMDRLAAGTSARLENEALRASKDMAGTAAKLKSDLKDMIAAEKQAFGRQSAGLESRFEGLGKSVAEVGKSLQELGGQAGKNTQLSAANRKRLEMLDKRLQKVLGEIVSWKKEYKLELDRLLKEIEG